MKTDAKTWIIRIALLCAIIAAPFIVRLATEEKLNPDAWTGHPDKGIINKAMRVAYDLNKEFHTSWLGVKMLQHPSDLMTYQEFILETRPEVIIETGTWHGGLTVFLASILDAMGSKTDVLTIDIDDQPWLKTLAAATFDKRLLDRIHFIKGSSIDPAILARIEGMVRGRPALVILDSNHSKEHVLAELRLYSKFVPKGGYILVNDTTLGGTHLGKEGVKDLGPLYAVRDFVAENKNFQIERSKPRFSVSCMHSGVLRRIE